MRAELLGLFNRPRASVICGNLITAGIFGRLVSKATPNFKKLRGRIKKIWSLGMANFKQRVIKFIQSVPKGKVVEDGQAAAKAGVTSAAGQVGGIDEVLTRQPVLSLGGG